MNTGKYGVFTVYVKSDEPFTADFHTYVDQEQFESVEFVVGALVSEDVYLSIRGRMISNNLFGRKRDMIRNLRAIGHDESLPNVTIWSLKDLAENKEIRGNY